MKNNISPEERLLRLIRGHKKQDVSVEKKSDVPIMDLKIASKETAAFFILLKYIRVINLKKIIWTCFIISSICLIVSFVYPWVGLRKIKLPQVTPQNLAESKTELKQEVKPYEFYLDGIQNRQIFSSSTAIEAEKSISSLDTDLMKDLNLVGIISGDNPVGIIEDKKTQKTYYLSKGQFIGEFQVEDIQEGKIVLNYGGERFELHL